MHRNVMALKCFAGNPFGMDKQLVLCHRVYWTSPFSSLLPISAPLIFFPLSFPTPLFFVHVCFLLNVFQSGLFFSCPSLFHVPLRHILSISPFAEAHVEQYWRKEFEESETEKDPLEDTYKRQLSLAVASVFCMAKSNTWAADLLASPDFLDI